MSIEIETFFPEVTINRLGITCFVHGTNGKPHSPGDFYGLYKLLERNMYTGNRQLKVFYTVANTHSFTRAAKMLHMTQPAVSSQIQRFEEYYGIRLFHRNHDGVTLTDTGRMAYGYAERVVQLINELDYKLRNKDIDEEELRMGVTSDTINFFVHSLLEGFARKNPNVNIQVKLYDNDNIFFKLGDQSIDLAITMNPLADRNISVERSWKIPLSVVVPRAHPLNDLQAITIDQLIEYTILYRGNSTDLSTTIVPHISENGVDRNPLDILDGLANLETLVSAVQVGMGIGIIPKTEGKGLRQSSELRLCDIDPKITLSYHLIRDTRYSCRESVHTLLEHME